MRPSGAGGVPPEEFIYDLEGELVLTTRCPLGENYLFDPKRD
jgi:hypothetical protein